MAHTVKFVGPEGRRVVIETPDPVKAPSRKIPKNPPKKTKKGK